MNQAVIFDLDGVIVDTALFHYRGWKKLADELKIPFDEQANDKLRGLPRRESLLALLGGKKLSEKQMQTYMDRKNAYYLEMVKAITPADTLPGAKQLVEALKQAGYGVAVASSSKNAKLVLQRLELTKLFEVVVDGTAIEKGKPDPELFLKAAKRLGVLPQNCLVVEDAESGIEAGIAAGMHTLGLGSPQVLGRAQRVVPNLAKVELFEVEQLLQGIPVPGDARLHPAGLPATDPSWFVSEDTFDQPRQAWRESLFALANGYLGVRGSVEEHDLPYPDSRPDTLVAGIFETYESWYQAIVNLPFPFATRFELNGETFSMRSGSHTQYSRRLDMYRGLLVRELVWKDSQGRETYFEFTRLVSLADPHLAALRVRFKPLNWSGEVKVHSFLDGEVDNIDFHKSGYQLRGERYYFVETESKGSWDENQAQLTVKTKQNPHRVAEAWRTRVTVNGQPQQTGQQYWETEQQVHRNTLFWAQQGSEYCFEKMIGLVTNRDGKGLEGDSLARAADRVAQRALQLGFERVAEDHAAAWCTRWRAGDVVIEGNASDQQATRFSLFHLNQFANPRDPRINIGSRGLTAEMHYGNCFWDTELFIMPYFIYTWPESARALVQYRHETLPEARNKAKRLFFKGAMFPWMSSYPGKEQADYWEYANIAVHIVGDIHYALEHYRTVTGDEDFMLQYGAEVVLEVARFWQSRSFYNVRRKAYCINTVKGPNEYDGVINNNTYTNWQARYTLRSAVKLAAELKKKHPQRWAELQRKLKLTPAEVQSWSKTAAGMFIHYDAKQKLYIEDDSFLDKEPFNMKALKPGKKIITELGVSWDTLLRLQIVKQADILLLMQLFPDAFTREQKMAAWKYYEPKTCHDSSLSYCTHSLMAAQLGLSDQAMRYWDLNARLDLDDLMDNSFLGVHSASVGGTWQIIALGFAGMRVRENGFDFTPRLPKRWKRLQFNLIHRGRLLQVDLTKQKARFTLAPGTGPTLQISLGAKPRSLAPGTTLTLALNAKV